MPDLTSIKHSYIDLPSEVFTMPDLTSIKHSYIDLRYEKRFEVCHHKKLQNHRRRTTSRKKNYWYQVGLDRKS